MSGPAGDDEPERGVGGTSERVLFIDAPSGVAGDMLVAALLDLGAGTEEDLAEALSRFAELGGHRLVHGRARRHGIEARTFRVEVTDPDPPHRRWATIRGWLEGAPLPEEARRIALRAFTRLAEAEAAVHRTPVDEVHFHEVGAVDSIVDIVGTALLLARLDLDRVVSSPLPMSRGWVDTQHGRLPLPAPATVRCLFGVPTVDAGLDGFELVTPTGACLVATVADGFARWPRLRPEAVGWGAGTRELPDRPNLLRLVLGNDPGERAGPEASRGDAGPSHVVVEANIDDATPEVLGHALERLLEEGALDAWTAPIGMKKSRPGVRLSALAPASAAQRVAATLLAETTSLGARIHGVDRVERPRRRVEVSTPFGPIPVKVAADDGLPRLLSPELEACRAAARAHRVPLRQVMEAATLAAAAAADLTPRDA
ncbi:MAG TPA: nickel pincer cofactor biosynthesis protein LarC [Polyangiaceae bacterium LLY-WYZ-14_1]|nr:nickel pincer cofactor biosynthesis protein LarC [Polyangiaceae bacterium LLY-WYZ-14_1]